VHKELVQTFVIQPLFLGLREEALSSLCKVDERKPNIMIPVEDQGK